MKAKLLIILILISACNNAPKNINNENNASNELDGRVDSVLSLMTLEEKIGQMNQYNGFWDVTGPVPAEGDEADSSDHLKKSWVGSMINVKGVEEVRKVQSVAVEGERECEYP